jgi:phage shock protein PspC (stress-responsive transcriptional regulator)
MQTSQPSVFARDHTILGVCEALGEDFGFNPLLLRIPLSVCLLLNPFAVIGIYAALAIPVALSRFLAPNPRPAGIGQPAAADSPPQTGENDGQDMALAA